MSPEITLPEEYEQNAQIRSFLRARALDEYRYTHMLTLAYSRRPDSDATRRFLRYVMRNVDALRFDCNNRRVDRIPDDLRSRALFIPEQHSKDDPEQPVHFHHHALIELPDLPSDEIQNFTTKTLPELSTKLKNVPLKEVHSIDLTVLKPADRTRVITYCFKQLFLEQNERLSFYESDLF